MLILQKNDFIKQKQKIIIKNLKMIVFYLIIINGIMRKQTLLQNHQIMQQLSLLCLDDPKRCKKQSKLGWTSNERILLLHDGQLQYYNYHPSFEYNRQSALARHNLKGSIKIVDILQVNFLPRNKARQNIIAITFTVNKMRTTNMPANSQNKEKQQDFKNNKEQIEKWVFEFTFDVKQYIETKKQQKRQEIRMRSRIQETPYNPNLVNQESEAVFARTNTNTKSGWQVDEQKVDIQTYVRSIQKTREFLKKKAEQAEQEALRQKKKNQKQQTQNTSRQNTNIQVFAISSFWRDYFKAYELVLRKEAQGASKKQLFQTQMMFLRQVDYFNEKAAKIVRMFIEQKIAGINIHKKRFQSFNYFMGLWIKIGDKQLNQQFLVNYYLNDILHSLKKVNGFKFRVPLMSLMKFKGIKVLVMCDMPFSQIQKSEVYNLSKDGYDLQIISRVKECLAVLQDVLNVKNQPIDINYKKKVQVPLGQNVKVFEYNFKNDNNQDQVSLPNFYYIINPCKVFPLDYHAQKEQIKPMCRLRPQLVALFRDYYKEDDCQLLVQAFMNSQMPGDYQQYEDEKVIKASKLIQTYCIPALLEKLNNLQLMFVDSHSISNAFHEMGINMRYAYLIYQKARLPYIQEMIKCQVLARTIKSLFRSSTSDVSEVIGSHRIDFDKIGSEEERVQKINQIRNKSVMEFKSIAIDYLNLVFGQGKETEQFWTIIKQKCLKKFKIQTEYPPLVSPGCLLMAVLWHCCLTIELDQPIPLFEQNEPFTAQMHIDYDLRYETFDFPSFEVQKMFKNVPKLEDHLDIQLFKEVNHRLNKMQLTHSRALVSDQTGSWTAQTVLSKLNNYQEFYVKPKISNQMHPVFLTHYIKNKSQPNFKKAEKILDFSLPYTHPLNITLHLQYAGFFQENLMKQTVLLVAAKSLGQFHHKAVELYYRFYKQGMKQLRIHAKRVRALQTCTQICSELYSQEAYEGCFKYCWDVMDRINSKNNSEKLGSSNYVYYIKILEQGLDSAIKTIQLEKGIAIAQEITRISSSFKYQTKQFLYNIFQKVTIIQLLRTDKKYYIYKLVLLVIDIRKKHENIKLSPQGLSLPSEQPQRSKILQGLSNQYYGKETHSNWVAYILQTLLTGFQYFNFLQNLFSHYKKHLDNYNNIFFRQCLGYLDILVRLFGQQLFKSTIYDIRFH